MNWAFFSQQWISLDVMWVGKGQIIGQWMKTGLIGKFEISKKVKVKMWGGTYDYLEIEYWKQRWPFLLVQLYIYIYKRHLACELTWPFTKLNETLNEVKSSAFMSTWELNNPIIHILLSKDSYMAPNHTKSLWKQHYDFWKGIKILWPCPSHVVWFFLIEREHEVSSFYTWKQSFALFSPDVGLSPALQISKTHGFDCDKK